ncbi:MAG: ribosome-associated translation inhibitor RaiA [Flavobacteriaceae bacterium]
MTVQISGKNIDIGEALRGSINSRLADGLSKYFDRGYGGHVVISREGSQFKAECHLHLDSGIMLKSQGEAPDAYQSFDKAAIRLEKRLRRYNRRLNDHHPRDFADSDFSAADYMIAPEDEGEEERGDNPVIVAETRATMKKMTVGMAVMALDLADVPVIVFTNIANERINVVYRRKDGHIGWIDPETAAG